MDYDFLPWVVVVVGSLVCLMPRLNVWSLPTPILYSCCCLLSVYSFISKTGCQLVLHSLVFSKSLVWGFPVLCHSLLMSLCGLQIALKVQAIFRFPMFLLFHWPLLGLLAPLLYGCTGLICQGCMEARAVPVSAVRVPSLRSVCIVCRAYQATYSSLAFWKSPHISS